MQAPFVAFDKFVNMQIKKRGCVFGVDIVGGH